MPKVHAVVDVQQPGCCSRRRRIRADPESLGGAEHVASSSPSCLRGREQQSAAGCRPAASPRAAEALLDASRQRERCTGARTRPPARAGVKPARQLEQRERVAPCLGDDPVAHSLVERRLDRRRQQRTASWSPRGSTASSGSPASSSLRSRVAKMNATRSASTRRATSAGPGPTLDRATVRRRRCTAAAAPPRPHAGRPEHRHAPLTCRSLALGQQTRLADPGLAAQHERLASRGNLVQKRRQKPLFLVATQQRRNFVTSRADRPTLILPRPRGVHDSRVELTARRAVVIRRRRCGSSR